MWASTEVLFHGSLLQQLLRAWSETATDVVEVVLCGICISTKMWSTSSGCLWEWRPLRALPHSSTESFVLGRYVAL